MRINSLCKARECQYRVSKIWEISGSQSQSILQKTKNLNDGGVNKTAEHPLFMACTQTILYISGVLDCLDKVCLKSVYFIALSTKCEKIPVTTSQSLK